LHADTDRAMVTESPTTVTPTESHMRLLIIEDDRETP
jgi:hypothetical protein